MNIINTDEKIIHFFQKAFIPTARIGLFIVYAWFGMLKVLGLSPAGPLVHQLFDATISFIAFDTFYLLFAWFEVLVGVLFLIPKATRIVIPLLLVHMVTTILPLIFLPGATWNGFMVLTIEGQYIVKNILIIAAAIGIAAHAEPLSHRK